jgi:hypothetical protein
MVVGDTGVCDGPWAEWRYGGLGWRDDAAASASASMGDPRAGE